MALEKKNDTMKMKDEIDFAFAYQDGEWLKTSNRLLNEFKGKYYKNKSGMDRYVINTIFSLVNLILPNLIFQKPYIKVKPTVPFFMRKKFDGSFEKIDNIEAAEVMEASINHVMSDIDAWENMQQAIQDALYYSIGVTKTGYSVDTESIDDMDFIKEENPFVMRVCPKDLGFHPLATNPGNASVMVHHMIRHRDDLKENENYKNTDDLKASLPDELKKKVEAIKKDAAGEYIRVWEVHNQKKGMLYTFAGENKKLLWKRKKNSWYKGSDFNTIKFAGDNDEFLGIPLLGMIENEAIALNELITYMMKHVRMFPGVVDTEEGNLDADGMQRLQNQEQGSIHTWGSLNAIKRTPPLPMGSDYFNLVNLLFSIIDRILGIPDFQRGISTKRKTATEATLEEGSSTIRREYYIGIVKKFILQNVERVASLIQQHFDEEKLIPVMGKTDLKFISYTKEDIQGNYSFDFDVDSMRFINEAQANSLINALNVMAAHPALQPILGTLDPELAAKEIFKRMNLNIEALRPRDHQTKLYFSPEKENELVMQGMDLPDPKLDEDHKMHLELHELVQGNPEMERHKRFHMALQAQKQPQMQLGTPPMGQEMGPQPDRNNLMSMGVQNAPA